MPDLAWPNIIPKLTYPASYWAVTPDATHLMQSTTTYCHTDEGGSTCSKSGPPYAVVTTEKVNGSQNLTTTDVFDGLGRATQHQLNSDPAGVDYTSATYDADGRIVSITKIRTTFLRFRAGWTITLGKSGQT